MSSPCQNLYFVDFDEQYASLDFDEILLYESIKESFEEKLLKQIRDREDLYPLAYQLIYSLDEKGFLVEDDIFYAQEFNVDEVKIKQVRELVKSLVPYGCACKDVRECLCAQIKYSQKTVHEKMAVIFEKSFYDLVLRQFRKLKQEYKIDDQILNEILESLKNFYPYPRQDEDADILIQADIYCRLSEDKLELEMPHNGSRIQLLYEDYAKVDKDLFKEAQLVLNALEKRDKSLLLIVSKILEVQKESILKDSPLKPLSAKDLASMVSLNESTVSRCLNQKYIRINERVYLLKSFIQNECIENISSDEINSILEDILRNEDTKEPYSDRELEEILHQKGIKIARRTVTKYRERLGYLPSKLRKTP